MALEMIVKLVVDSESQGSSLHHWAILCLIAVRVTASTSERGINPNAPLARQKTGKDKRGLAE
jgi:hypothetical protein